jgi:hypothetical protein
MDNNFPTYAHIGRKLSMPNDMNQMGAREKAKQIIRQSGGIIKTSVAIQAGIHPRTLYQLRDSGELELISRGIYPSSPDKCNYSLA